MSPTPNSPEDPTPTAAKDDATDDETRERTGVAEEDEQSRLATHKDPTLHVEPDAPAADRRARVEWVRPTDLAARAGGRVMERGHELNRQLMSAVKEAAREQRDALRQRMAARSAEVSVTGPERAPGRAAGREGVSR